jgi:hypothetical protein
MLDEARAKNYHPGVLGVRARPEWTEAPAFSYEQTPVDVVPCESALAVWEAITQRKRGQWLVVLTDRPDEDLGAGIRAHLVGHRLRTPDPWQAVRQRFAATGIDPALTLVAGHRDVAIGLLAAMPQEGWPPAVAGVLTRDHAFAAVAAAHLRFADQVVDLTSVLGWTADPGVATWIADLRELAGNALADAVLAWLADRCAAVSVPMLHLLRTGEARDAVPLGLVAGVLAAAADAADETRSRLGREGLIRIEPALGGAPMGTSALISWAAEAAAIVSDMLLHPASHSRGQALLAQADDLLATARADGLAGDSELLPSGLGQRLAALAAVLRQALPGGAGNRTANPDESWVSPDALAVIERAWTLVATHQLATPGEPRVAAFHAAVRLTRWLSSPVVAGCTAAAGGGRSLASLVSRHVSEDAWADSAVNDASAGVSDPGLAAGLAAVLAAAADRRAAHDVTFAAALARHTAQDEKAAKIGAAPAFWHLEDLLPEVVIPLAREVPVLLLILDGMSAGVATEIITSLLVRTGEGWAEALLAGQGHRAAGLAVLPTLTEVSRTSLLCGALASGSQDAERRGYDRLWAAHGLTKAELFHKRPLDSSLPGYALAADVAEALGDVTGRPLVTSILNTIDDALDRSDPGGTEWTASAVRHLMPLLDQARRSGRVVILTADHGHVVERRQGVQHSYEESSSGRSRAAVGKVEGGEILVTGSRVLLHGGKAVLAVDEKLRYGPLKAGYHGGASAAEVVVPVAVLVSGSVPEGASSRLQLAPPQEPSWWTDPITVPAADDREQNAPARPGRRTAASARPRRSEPRVRDTPRGPLTLFDLPSVEVASSDSGALAEDPGGAADGAASAGALASAIVGSVGYAAQRKIAGRLSIQDGQVRALLAALLAASSGRLAPAQAAAALKVAPGALRGAILHVQRLLNVEGYAVLRIDADGTTVILDESLLREQFGVEG